MSKNKEKFISKYSETEIQNYIWENRHNFSELFDEIETPRSQLNIAPEKLEAYDLIKDIFYQRLANNYSSAMSTIFISCETPLEEKDNSTIRADFLGQPTGVSGLTVIELKKSKQSEKSAFTQLLAYSGALAKSFPGVSRRDIHNILICPNESRLISEAFIYSIVVEQKNICILEIYFKGDEKLENLRFRPFIPEEKDLIKFSSALFVPKNFDVVKITWGGEKGEWIPDEEKKETFKDYKNILNNVASLASSFMEEQGIIGFTFSSQLWEEDCSRYACPNSIIMVALNPFHAGIQRSIVELGASAEELESDHIYYSLPLEEIIKGINKSRYIDDDQLKSTLEEVALLWNDSLYGIGFRAVKLATKNVENTYSQRDRGSFTWDQYQNIAAEDVYCHHGEVFPSSLLRNMYLYYLENLFSNNKFTEVKDFFSETDGIKSPLINHYKSNFRLRDFLKFIGCFKWEDY